MDLRDGWLIWKLKERREGWLAVTPEGLASNDVLPAADLQTLSTTGRNLLFIHGTFSSTTAAFKELAKTQGRNGKTLFTQEMQKVYPEIRRIDLIPYPDSTQGPISIYTKDNKIIPLHAFGDGMRRWFYLLGHLIVYKSAVHCIEEIDSTFHSTAHYELSRLLVTYAQEYSNQLFMTSHSMEFIDTFLNALYGEDGILQHTTVDPVRVFTIRRSSDNQGHEVWPLTGKEAFEKRSQFDLELR